MALVRSWMCDSDSTRSRRSARSGGGEGRDGGYQSIMHLEDLAPLSKKLFIAELTSSSRFKRRGIAKSTRHAPWLELGAECHPLRRKLRRQRSFYRIPRITNAVTKSTFAEHP